jgi:hypothetical protein
MLALRFASLIGAFSFRVQLANFRPIEVGHGDSLNVNYAARLYQNARIARFAMLMLLKPA